MSIHSLLNELVSSVDGAIGAIIVAGDGEAVQWVPTGPGERLRLRGAYVAVVMQAYRSAQLRAGLEPLRHLVIEYDWATLVALEIDPECLMVLELKSRANAGVAVYRLRAAEARLRDEINA